MIINSIESDQRALHITWQDQTKTEFPFILLRDNDPDELHPDTHERTFDLTSVELDIAPLSYDLNQMGTTLTVEWPAKLERSNYSSQWLYAHRPGVPRHDPARIAQTSWAEAALRDLPRFDAQACSSSSQALSAALNSLKSTGIIIVHNLDDEVTAGQEFGDLIGFKRESNYGVMFEVKSKPNPNNLAYTALALPLHTDLANQEFVPGNQFLHCYRNTASGGESIFADALSVVDEFKADHPRYYELLCDAQVPWHFIDDESDIRMHRPVINISPAGVFKGLTFNAHLADVPDFKADLMYDFYAAFRELMVRIRTAKYNIKYLLKSGEMVVFDNQRILHGRASFDPDSGERHLRGYYIEHNEVDNRIRMLAHKNKKIIQ